MDERALFVKFWEHEAKTTHTVLSRIPEGSTYKPDPKSRTAAEIAWQIVCEEKMIIEALESGKRSGRRRPSRRRSRNLRRYLSPAEHGHPPSLEDAASVAWDGPVQFFGHDRPARRWPGAFSSTSSITAGRSGRTCGRWDRPSRKSTGRAGTSRKRQVQITSPPYGANARSWVTSVARSTRAWATSTRSKGSAWCAGSDARASACASLSGNSVKSSAASKTPKGSRSFRRPSAALMDTSQADTALTHTTSAVAIAWRAALFRRRSSDCHHRMTCVSSRSFTSVRRSVRGTPRAHPPEAAR